jgi:hypothetical protein
VTDLDDDDTSDLDADIIADAIIANQLRLTFPTISHVTVCALVEKIADQFKEFGIHCVRKDEE